MWSNKFMTFEQSFFKIMNENFFDFVHFHSILFCRRWNNRIIFSKFKIYFLMICIIFMNFFTFVTFWNVNQLRILSIKICLKFNDSFIFSIVSKHLILITSIRNLLNKIFILNHKNFDKKWYFKKKILFLEKN